MEWCFHARDARAALAARPAFLSFLYAWCTAASDCQAAEIVFGELVANVVRHAPGRIDITARADDRGVLTLTVCDRGPRFTYAPALPASDFSACGRGLHIVSRLCKRVTLEHSGYGNTINVVLPVVANRKLQRAAAS